MQLDRKRVMWLMGGTFHETECLRVQCGSWFCCLTVDILFCCVYCLFQGLTVRNTAVSLPGNSAGGYDARDGASAECGEDMRREAHLLHSKQNVEVMLSCHV